MSNGGLLYPEILKQFLCHRHNRKSQERFVCLCLSLTRKRLRYFRAKGWILPSMDLSANDPLEVPSNDIVGTILSMKDGESFGRLFSFFRSQGVDNFDNTDAEVLWEIFQPFLYRSIRQERSRLLNEEDPAKAKIKKSVNEALKTDEYHRWKGTTTGSEFVASSKYNDKLRESCPSILFEELLELVAEAFRESLNQRDLCRKIFDELNRHAEFKNFLEHRQLVHAVVIVNLREMDIEGLALPTLPGADHGLQITAILQARIETIEIMKESVLARYVTKGKLTEQQVNLLATACETYLKDLAHSNGTDSRRTYFDEVIPGVDRPMYEKLYKNIFDTLISKAETEFENHLRKLL